MHITKASKIISAYFLFAALYWVILHALHIRSSGFNDFYQLLIVFLPLGGGIAGLVNSTKWGGLKSKVGAAVFFIAAGLVGWSLGQAIWTFYNIVLHVEVPYPSWADAGYITAYPLWAIGMVYLSKATGAAFSFKKMSGKFFLFLIPLAAAVVTYYLLIVVARGGVIDFNSGSLKLFFDFVYPVSDLAILILALLIYGLSFNYLGGRFKIPIITLVVGFILMYAADFSFSYTTTLNQYYSGHWVDLFFPVVMAILAFGLNNLDPDVPKDSK